MHPQIIHWLVLVYHGQDLWIFRKKLHSHADCKLESTANCLFWMNFSAARSGWCIRWQPLDAAFWRSIFIWQESNVRDSLAMKILKQFYLLVAPNTLLFRIQKSKPFLAFPVSQLYTFYSAAEMHRLAKTTYMKRVMSLTFSIFVRRHHLQHAGAGWEENFCCATGQTLIRFSHLLRTLFIWHMVHLFAISLVQYI